MLRFSFSSTAIENAAGKPAVFSCACTMRRRVEATFINGDYSIDKTHVEYDNNLTKI